METKWIQSIKPQWSHFQWFLLFGRFFNHVTETPLEDPSCFKQKGNFFFLFLISVSEAQNPISVQVSQTALGTGCAEAPLHYTSLSKQEQRGDGAIPVSTHTPTHSRSGFVRGKSGRVSTFPYSSAVSAPNGNGILLTLSCTIPQIFLPGAEPAASGAWSSSAVMGQKGPCNCQGLTDPQGWA